MEERDSDSSDERPPELEKQLDRDAGLIFGAAMAGVGLLCSLGTVGWPLLQALRGAAGVVIYPKLAMGSIAMIVMGAWFACGFKFVENENHVSVKDLSVLALFTGIGLGAFFLFRWYLGTLGYRFDL